MLSCFLLTHEHRHKEKIEKLLRSLEVSFIFFSSRHVYYVGQGMFFHQHPHVYLDSNVSMIYGCPTVINSEENRCKKSKY